MKDKVVLTRIIRCIAFMLIAALLLSIVTMIYLPKWSYDNEVGQVSGFYQEDKNTIDVIGLGSCNMYSSFSPVIMYEKFGITGYNMCCPDQEESTSYYYIKEALKTQKPKVVILESLFFSLKNNSKREHYNRFAVDYLPPSLNKIMLAAEIAKTEAPLMKTYDPTAPDPLLTFFGYLFPILRYHGKTDLKDSDLTYFLENDLYNFYKGGLPQYTYTTNDDNFFSKVFNSPDINDTTKKFFPKIVKLCEDNGIQLVVMKSPNYARWGYDDKQTKVIRDFVAGYGIPFVDFHSDELNTFEEYDYGYSTGRLNVYGMNKLSEEMGQWLVDNLGLTPTVLDEESKARWDNCVAQYYAVSKEKGCNIYPGQIAELRNTETGITVRWNAAEGAKTYSVYRCEGKGKDYTLLEKAVSGVVYEDKDLEPGQGYSYYIVPNQGKLAGQKSEVCYHVFLDPPRNFIVYNDDGVIRFNWDAADAAGAYRIQRRADTAFNFTRWDTTKQTTYYNAMVDQGEQYFYRLCTTLTQDNVTYYSKAVVATAVSQVTPCIVSCSDKNGAALITWNKISGSNGIEIWRGDSADGEFERIDKVSSGNTQYTDKTVEKGNAYFYKIRYTSKNLENVTESAFSNMVSINVRK